MTTQIQLRRDTGANWDTNSTVILAAGEIGVNLTNGQFKLGDGTSTWAQLSYYASSGSASTDIYKFQYGIIGTQDNPDTGGWGGYNITLDPGGESWAGINIPSVANQEGGTLSLYNSKTVNNAIQLSVQTGAYTFRSNEFDVMPDARIRQNNSFTRTTTSVVSAGSSVVWVSTENYISGVKLVIQVEANEVGDASGWHSQVCEAVIASRGYANGFAGPGGTPVMTVYGVTYTSTAPLVTFTVQRNPTTKMIEVVGTSTAAADTAPILRIYSVETSTND